MRKIITLFVAALCCASMFALDGALPGKFSVSATKQVVFSQGNLQYVNGIWQFAADQCSRIGSEQTDEQRDLFAWGTGDAPNKIYGDPADYTTFVDWGVNAISNGGNEANIWRTLTHDEWVYLFEGRENAKDKFGFGNVKGTTGLIILPDEWVQPTSANTFTPSLLVDGFAKNEYNVYYNENGNNFEHNLYYGIGEQWDAMEAAGAVFLPLAGDNVGWPINIASGNYWTSTRCSEATSYMIFFNQQYFNINADNGCNCGYSVRLVVDAEKISTALDNTSADAKATKRLVNGQLLIIHNGRTFNALGVEVK